MNKKKPKKIIFKTPSSESFEELKEDFEEIPQQDFSSEPKVEVLDAPPPGSHAEILDKYQRCLAEFDNFRKRTTKEMAERYGDGIRAACEKLLPITDNFERALAAHDSKDDAFYKGIEMLARQFDTVLDELGVKCMDTAPGTPFDTNIHYAVAHTEDASLGENTVAEVLQKGYTHREKVIRPAMVKVAN